jgi:hypothetical protein
MDGGEISQVLYFEDETMRGRKPLPSNVVKLRGNPGKRRLNDAEQGTGEAKDALAQMGSRSDRHGSGVGRPAIHSGWPSRDLR